MPPPPLPSLVAAVDALPRCRGFLCRFGGGEPLTASSLLSAPEAVFPRFRSFRPPPEGGCCCWSSGSPPSPPMPVEDLLSLVLSRARTLAGSVGITAAVFVGVVSAARRPDSGPRAEDDEEEDENNDGGRTTGTGGGLLLLSTLLACCCRYEMNEHECVCVWVIWGLALAGKSCGEAINFTFFDANKTYDQFFEMQNFSCYFMTPKNCNFFITVYPCTPPSILP
jgi:hypothetical protein